MTRNYLLELEIEVLEKQEDYILAVIELQSVCEHKTVLMHEDSEYANFYVCEDCGITARTTFRSWVHAYGETKLIHRRHYEVSWPDFVSATPGCSIGWAQKRYGSLSAAEERLAYIRPILAAAKEELDDISSTT